MAVVLGVAFFALLGVRGADTEAGNERAAPRSAALSVCEVLVFGALVATLFLAVTMLITGWGHDPIVGAAIVASGPFERKSTTDEYGAFSIRLPIGDYSVSVSSFGYLPETESVTIEEGATVELAFSLESAPSFVVEGTLSDVEGSPLAGASVELLNTPLPTLTTDDDGFGIKAQAEDVSDVSEVSVSEPSVSEPSEPSVSEPSVSEPSEPSSSS